MRLPKSTKSGNSQGPGASGSAAPSSDSRVLTRAARCEDSRAGSLSGELSHDDAPLDGQLAAAAVQSNSGDRPTPQAYGDVEFPIEFFNQQLFDGRLPPTLVTFARKPRSLGFFAAERFADTTGKHAHEVSLNPRHLEALGDYQALAVLAQVLCQVYRYECVPGNRKGGKGARGYHDKATADVMRSIGLMPSHTGRPGGRQTGYKMRHCVEEGGRFDVACRELLVSGFTLRWRDKVQRGRQRARQDGSLTPSVKLLEAPAQTRAKFTCGSCRLNAWAKPSARLACLTCSAPMSLTTT